MATGKLTFKGLSVPLYGESTITQITVADDVLTIKGASTSPAGDALVIMDSAGTEKQVFSINPFLNKRVTGTVALASLASNASEATVALTGITTNHVVQIFAAGSGPLPNVYVSEADKLGYGPASRASAAMTVTWNAWLTV